MKTIRILAIVAILILTVSCNRNLSVNGSANCYVVSKAGTYSFPTVKGNSTTSVGSVSQVEVLWESFGTSTAPSKGNLIQRVSYSSGTITFSTPSTLRNGNAVIAAKDESGNILWSWHIWVCSGYDPAATAQAYYNNAGVMMDRNLGATSTTPGDVCSLGLMYQWGRKDPFLGSGGISSNTMAASTLTWPSNVSSTSSTGTIAYATAHPTTFITYAYDDADLFFLSFLDDEDDNNYDWFYTRGSNTETDNDRWQAAKTIFDPCPPGWKIPEGGLNGVWSKAVGSRNIIRGFSYDSTNEGMDFSGKFGSAGTIWYPASGYLSHTGHGLNSVGDSGSCWSCTPYGCDAFTFHLSSYDGYVYPSCTGYRAGACSVRCIQE